MKKISIIIALSFLCIFSNLFGEDITINVLEAGMLNTSLSEAGHNLNAITELKITGEIDATDFVTIRNNIKNLTSIDLSEVEIKAFTGTGGTSMLTNDYPANTIPDWAFFSMLNPSGNTTLTSISLGQEAIGSQAFQNCKALTSIDFGNNLKTINSSAFFNCSEITEIRIPSSVEAIEQNAFAGCSNVERFEFETSASITIINKGVVPIAKITSLTIPASIEKIVDEAFINYHGLVNVDENNLFYSAQDGVLYNKDKTTLIAATGIQGSLVLPETVKIIGAKAFYNNTGLTSITFPNSLEIIETDAFYRGDVTESTLSEIIIDPQLSNLHTIERRGLSTCKKLTKLIIPKNVTAFGDNALAYNTSLSEIHCFIENPATITSYVFEGVSKTNCTLIVPKGTVDLYKSTPAWNLFNNIEEEGSNQLFVTPLTLEFGSLFVNELSSNGKYAVGRSGYGAYRWDIKNSSQDNFDILYLNGDGTEYNNTISEDVTNDGVVLGNYEQTYKSSLINGPGIWENGTWTSLLVEDPNYEAPTVNSITNDAQTVAGNYMPDAVSIMPYSWNKEGSDWKKGTTWSYPAGGQGARIHSFSKDHSIACGWSVNENTNGNRVPIYWTSPSEYKIIGTEKGEARKVSDNGKYIALTYDSSAALYKIETEEIIMIKNNAEALDVSDNGIVVGYYTTTNSARNGFIWTEKDGFADLYDILSLYVPDAEIDEFSPAYESLDQISCISADGRVMGGWKAYNSAAGQGFIFTLKEDYKPLKKPVDFTANAILSERNKVLIKWNAPNNDSEKKLTGYVIYREQEELMTLDASQTVYTDDLSSTQWNNGGSVRYAITALYDNTYRSPRSEDISVLIYDSYDIPFVDDFEDINLSNNYWTMERNFTYNFWFINPVYPNGYKGTSMTFSTVVSGQEYNESVISKPFDARGESTVYLSYLNSIDVLQTILDKVYVEVQKSAESEEWITVKEHTITKTDWTFYEVDLSDQVAGKIFRVRFRAAGNDGSLYYFEIDNMQIRTEREAATSPQSVIATVNNDETISLSWQNPSSSYGLSYSISEPWQGIGNNGASFIGANKFETEDLNIYKDQYLTSISTYIGYDISLPFETTLKLAVFEDDTRICDQTISYFEENEWNTFVLDTPIKIDPSKTLYMGIEVVTHNAGELPLFTDQSVNKYDGKGNLFSEDGGATWQKLSAFNLTHTWCIIGNVRKESVGSENDRDYTIWGYNIFRDGVKLNNSLMEFAQTYIDDISGVNASQVCYTIQAYYGDSAWSALSEDVCTTTVDIKEVTTSNKLNVYPNPVEDYLLIDGLEKEAQISIYDLSGRLMFVENIFLNQRISVQGLQSGIYILSIQTENNTQEIKIQKR